MEGRHRSRGSFDREHAAIGVRGPSRSCDGGKKYGPPIVRPGPPPRPSYRQLFRQPGYRRLWTARTVSQWGDVFNFVALALLVFKLTGTGLGVSGVVVAEIAPVLLLAPVAGAVADRFRRVDVMVGADIVRVALALLLIPGQSNAAAVYALAFAMSAAAAFFNPAASSTLPALVGDDELVTANGGIWTAAVVSQIALAPVAAAVAATLGFGVAFGVNAASFAVSALVLRGLRGEQPPDRTATTRWRWRTAVRDGARHLARDRLLRALAGAQLLAALSAGATSALLVVFAKEGLHVSTGQYGLLVGGIGIGAATGPLLLRRFVHQPRRPAVVFGAFAVRGGVDLALAPARSLAPAVTVLVAYGIGTSTGSVTFNSLVQAAVPAELRGRVFAAFDLLWQLGRLLSVAAGGLVADALGVRAVYYLGGLLLLAAALLGLGQVRAGDLGTARGGPARRDEVDDDGPGLGSGDPLR